MTNDWFNKSTQVIKRKALQKLEYEMAQNKVNVVAFSLWVD